jgi:hypothetical protein
MTVYAFGLGEHNYTSTGSHSGDLYYYNLEGRLLGSLDNNDKTTFYLTDPLGSVLETCDNRSNAKLTLRLCEHLPV